MSLSPVDICNLALAMLGESPIRNFTGDNNERARMCSTFYNAERDRLLCAFDWAFARKIVRLKQLVDDNTTVPSGSYRYQLPVDCKAARDIHPLGSPQRWEVIGDEVYTDVYPVYLYYTSLVEDTSKFSGGFVNLLSIGLALKMCMPFTHDVALKKDLKGDFREAELNAHMDNANVGSEYLAYDSDPDNDRFVDPDVMATKGDGSI